MVGAVGDERRDRPGRGGRRPPATACSCPGVSDVSEHTQQLIDEEVRRIVEDAERETRRAARARARPPRGASRSALLERETLDQPEAYEIAGVDPLPAAVAAAEASRRRRRRRSAASSRRSPATKYRTTVATAGSDRGDEQRRVDADRLRDRPGQREADRREADRDEPVEAVDAAAQLGRHPGRHQRPPDDHAGGHARALEQRDDDELPERASRTRSTANGSVATLHMAYMNVR